MRIIAQRTSSKDSTRGIESMDQSKLNVLGHIRSQKLNTGKYTKVKSRVRNFSEFAEGLSDGEKFGACFPMMENRKDKSPRPVKIMVRSRKALPF